MPRLKITENTHKPYTTSATCKCQYCSKVLNVKGHKNHEKACKTQTEIARRNREREIQLIGNAEVTRSLSDSLYPRMIIDYQYSSSY